MFGLISGEAMMMPQSGTKCTNGFCAFVPFCGYFPNQPIGRPERSTQKLFLRHAHAVLHFRKDCRTEEVALLKRAFELRRLATGHHCRTFFTRDVDITLDTVELLLRDLRTHLRRLVHRIADSDLARLLRELVEKLIFH